MSSKIMVKFAVSNPALINGIRLHQRNAAYVAGPKQPDNGTCTEHKNVSVKFLIATLNAHGTPLADIHYYPRQRGFMVVATFAAGGNFPGTIPAALTDSAWGKVYVWVNPNDTTTVNCGCRIPAEQKPANVVELELPS